MFYLFLLFTGILYSQNDLNTVMKKYANTNWHYLTEIDNKLVLYRYCELLSFSFDDKKIVTKDTPFSKQESYPIEKFVYNKEMESLEIYSDINGVTQKASVTEYDKFKIKIDFVYYIGEEDDSKIKRQVILTNKKGFKKVKNIEVCNQQKIKPRKVTPSDEPPPPPE